MVESLRTDNWREYQRWMQNQQNAVGGIQASINIAPMRELIPQLGPIRRTDGVPAISFWPGVNMATYIPFVVQADYWDVTAFDLLFTVFGTDNADVGIYTEAGIRLVSTGSLATATTWHKVVATTRLVRGRYYLGISMSGVTDTISEYSGTPAGNTVQGCHAAGIKAQASAFPLPATATLGAPGYQAVPACYVSIAAP